MKAGRNGAKLPAGLDHQSDFEISYPVADRIVRLRFIGNQSFSSSVQYFHDVKLLSPVKAGLLPQL